MVGTDVMSFDEAVALTRHLCADTSSWIAAAVRGWDHPFPCEAVILADLADILMAANSDRKRKPRRYPRPSDAKPDRLGSTARSQSEIRAELAKRGH